MYDGRTRSTGEDAQGGHEVRAPERVSVALWSRSHTAAVEDKPRGDTGGQQAVYGVGLSKVITAW